MVTRLFKFQLIAVPILITFFVMLPACKRNQDILQTEFFQFNSKGMVPDFQYSTAIEVDSLTATKKRADAWILIRYSDKCTISNLPLDVESTTLNSDSLSRFLIEIPLFENGQNKIKRDGLGLYESLILLKRDIDLSEGSFISFSTQESNTSGIVSIGILIKTAET